MTKRTTILTVSMLLLAVFLSAASAAEMVPLKGRFEGAGGQFWGNCTHLGKFDGKAEAQTYWYAANGDSLTWQVTSFIPGDTDPLFFHFELVQEIVDGTGRFKGAKGTVTLDIAQNLVTAEIDGTIDGTISRPNSGKK